MTLPIVALTLVAVYFIRQESRPDPDGEAATESLNNWKAARQVDCWASSIALAFVYMLAGAPKLTGLGGVPEEQLFSVDQSVDHLLEVVDGLTADDSGEFFDWAGEPIEW